MGTFESFYLASFESGSSMVPLFLLENPWLSSTAQWFSIFFLHILSLSYILLKIYKLLCYSKLTLEWLPLLNPYVWPYSVFHLITAPYFRFWSRILPPVKFNKTSFEISAIVALETLNTGLFFAMRLSNLFINFLSAVKAYDSSVLLDGSVF